jgi:hypothetical protein
VLKLLENSADFCSKDATRRSQRCTVTTALEEHNAQLLLQIPDLAAQRRLRDMHPRRRTAEMPFLSNGQEVAKMAEFHM